MANGTDGTSGAGSTMSFESIKAGMEEMFLKAQQQNFEVSKIQTEGNTKLRTAKVTPNG